MEGTTKEETKMTPEELQQRILDIEIKSDFEVNDEGEITNEIFETVDELGINVYLQNGTVNVSAENANSFYLVQYYREFGRGPQFIHDKLREVADDVGGYWEWTNAGRISLQGVFS